MHSRVTFVSWKQIMSEFKTSRWCFNGPLSARIPFTFHVATVSMSKYCYICITKLRKHSNIEYIICSSVPQTERFRIINFIPIFTCSIRFIGLTVTDKKWIIQTTKQLRIWSGCKGVQTPATTPVTCEIFYKIDENIEVYRYALCTCARTHAHCCTLAWLHYRVAVKMHWTGFPATHGTPKWQIDHYSSP